MPRAAAEGRLDPMGKTRAWLLYALAWVPIAALYIAALAQEIPLRRAVEGGIISVAFAAVLGVGVWRLTGRIPWRSERIGGFLLLHGLLAVVFSLLWLGAMYGRLAFAGGLDLVRHVAGEEGGWNVIVGVWIYGLLAGGSYAVRAERRAGMEAQAAARAEADRARAELRALRSRLEPHFLFNTLHTIRALVRSDPARAADAIETLGGLLRYVLDLDGRESERVPVREELEFTRAYLDLERTRLGDRLRVEESIDEAALDALVPALTLQPLVENAVRHGIGPRAAGGTIRIAVEADGDALRITVADDGPGADPDGDFDGPGMGLRTVRQRLASRYDGRSEVEVRTAPGEGFRVELRLPLEAT